MIELDVYKRQGLHVSSIKEAVLNTPNLPLSVIKREWIDMDTGQLIKLIVEAFVLIFALPCVYKDFMNLWKQK